MLRTSPRLKSLIGILALVLLAGAYRHSAKDSLPRLGATTTVTELTSGFELEARVDTGAQFCSIHCDAIEIPTPSDEPLDNIGKTVRFQIHDKSGQSVWIESRLLDHSKIRTADKTGGRYFVELPLRIEDVEAKVQVNLNNRSGMRYPFLVGRNFLRGRFLVDVRQAKGDLESN